MIHDDLIRDLETQRRADADMSRWTEALLEAAADVIRSLRTENDNQHTEIVDLRERLTTSQELCTKFEASVGEDLGEMLNLRAQLASSRKALEYASGYLMNAKIDLETGCPKSTVIKTIEGGLKMLRSALTDDKSIS